MRTMEGIKEWIRSRRSGHCCFFCGTYESKDSTTALYDYEDVFVCRRCLRETLTLSDLAQIYWAQFPEKMPSCMHCRRRPPNGDLWVAIRPDWHFCLDCLDHEDVKSYWRRVSRKLYERRWSELGKQKYR